MQKQLNLNAETVEQALQMAAEQLKMPEDKLTATVLQPSKKGLFGKIKEPALIQISYEEQPAQQAAEPDKKNALSRENKIVLATEYLSKMFDLFSIGEVDISTQDTGEHVIIQIAGAGVGTLIGRRGETLDAIQYLTSLAVNRAGGEYIRVIINSGNFREKREQTLRSLTERISRKAKQQGRSVALEPMNPYERRIIHTSVSNIDGVYSKSVGEEPNRKVVIYPESRRPAGRSGSRRPPKKKYDENYMPDPKTSSQPSTYDFEKEFLKEEKKDGSHYGKIDLD